MGRVWFVRNIKVLGRQPTVTAPIECKSFLAALANRAAPFVQPSINRSAAGKQMPVGVCSTAPARRDLTHDIHSRTLGSSQY
jgi:hypothetical protein